MERLYRTATLGAMRLPLAALLALAALPANAAAATFEPLKPCYQSVRKGLTEKVFVAGTGFTPNGRVGVKLNEDTVFELPTDAAGALPAGAFIRAPFVAKGVLGFRVTVTDLLNPANMFSQDPLVNALSMRLIPAKTSPSKRVLMRGRGFTRPGAVYAHYLYGTRRKHNKTVRLGLPSGDCGRISVRRKQFPFTPRAGRWWVQFDQQKAYSANPSGVFVQVPIQVRRVVRFAPA
jgi:hypothetical protein